MRYYDLEVTGKVKGSYACPQSEKVLYLLTSPPDDGKPYMRDGVPGNNWIVDQDSLDVINTRVALEAQKVSEININLPSWSQVDAAITAISSLAEAKAFFRKLTRVVYWLAKDNAS